MSNLLIWRVPFDTEQLSISFIAYIKANVSQNPLILNVWSFWIDTYCIATDVFHISLYIVKKLLSLCVVWLVGGDKEYSTNLKWARHCRSLMSKRVFRIEVAANNMYMYITCRGRGVRCPCEL